MPGSASCAPCEGTILLSMGGCAPRGAFLLRGGASAPCLRLRYQSVLLVHFYFAIAIILVRMTTSCSSWLSIGHFCLVWFGSAYC